MVGGVSVVDVGAFGGVGVVDAAIDDASEIDADAVDVDVVVDGTGVGGVIVAADGAVD